MEAVWKELPYEEIPVPSVIYKYRDWGNPWHKTILTDRVVYLSPPSKFEDPLDCKIPDRYDLLTDEELFQKFYLISRKENPHLFEQHHQNFANYWLVNTPLKNPALNKENQQRVFDDFDRRFGVLCLTANPENHQMWEKYASDHTGFCVGFSGRELLSDHERFGMAGNVRYLEELPIIHPHDPLLEKAAKRAFSKLNIWSFEEEYRISKIMYDFNNDDWRTIQIDQSLFLEIIFGANISETNKQEIIQISKPQFPNLRFRQAQLNQKSKSIQILDIDT